MIRAVAFDVMDTVLQDPYRDALVAATGMPVQELYRLRDPALYPALERGELDEESYWAHYADAGIRVDPDAFHRVRRSGLSWLPGMQELLDDLAGVVVRVTATNYPVWIEEVAADHLLGRFDRVVASCHLGARKPEPAFYAGLLEAVGVTAEELLFVDDRDTNVTGAREVGIVSHLFEDADRLRRWLAVQGVTIPPRRVR